MSSEETFLDEKIQSIVDRGPRDHGKLATYAGQNLFRGRMFFGVQNVLCDCGPLGRRIDSVLL